MEHLLHRIIELLESIDKKLGTHECVPKAELEKILKHIEREIERVEEIAGG